MRQPLWDIPTRLFHWSIVLLLPLAWWSAEEQDFDMHRWVGYSVIVLVATRIVWGCVGSRHSRFTDFIVGPGRILSYLRDGRSASAGHNPLGGWSVIVLLLLLLAQGVSGLFNSDDILYSGPFYYAAPDDFRDAMGVVHEWAFDLLLGFVGLHIAAVLFHQFVRKEPLVQAMVRGSAGDRQGIARPRGWWWALLIAALFALLLWWGIEQAPQPDPGRWF